jgi:PPIC-type PPIASE domain
VLGVILTRKSKRRYCRTVIIALFACLALAQTSALPQSDEPSAPPDHHRHDDDDQPPPASAASVPPDTPVITIDGVCDHTSGAASLSGGAKGQGSATPDSAKKESAGSPAGSTSPGCKTIVTKAQFEKLVDALNPQMPATGRRRIAESYPGLLLFADKAYQLGLDQDPGFAETMRYASMQILTQSLNRYFEQQASDISDANVEQYYKENAIRFERAELLRIFVPKQPQLSQTTASGEESSVTIDSPMRAVAEKIHARAAAGEDFQQLQKEAFEAAGIASESPNVSMGKMAATRLPLNHQKVFELEPGGVTDVIADPSGYYIYKAISKQMVPLSQASKEIRKSIASQRVQDSTAALNESIKSELNPVYFGALPRPGRRSGQTTSGDEPPAK